MGDKPAIYRCCTIYRCCKCQEGLTAEEAYFHPSGIVYDHELVYINDLGYIYHQACKPGEEKQVSDKVEKGTLVYYHGSIEGHHGFAVVAASVDDGRYLLALVRPQDSLNVDRWNGTWEGNGRALSNVRRTSFTPVDIPGQDERPALESGYFAGLHVKTLYQRTGQDSWYEWDGEGWEYAGTTDRDMNGAYYLGPLNDEDAT